MYIPTFAVLTSPTPDVQSAMALSSLCKPIGDAYFLLAMTAMTMANIKDFQTMNNGLLTSQWTHSRPSFNLAASLKE